MKCGPGKEEECDVALFSLCEVKTKREGEWEGVGVGGGGGIEGGDGGGWRRAEARQKNQTDGKRKDKRDKFKACLDG